MAHKKPTKLSETMIEIKDYMALHGGITQLEASTVLGVGRLTSRIGEMKDLGVPIEKETVKIIKRNGKPAYIASYKLVEEEGQVSLFK